jgi:hypothetical protein
MEEKIKEDILNFIKPHSIRFHTLPFVLFNVLKNIINTKEGLILVDLTGELTDVFLIRDNIIEEANCFAKGENFFIRRLASAFNVSFGEARALLLQYQRQDLGNPVSEKISNVLKMAGNEWGKSLNALLKDMADEKTLPQKLYFCGNSGPIKEIGNQLAHEEYKPLTSLGYPFDVKLLLPDSLKYHFSFKKGFSNTKNVFLLISALFANQILHKKQVWQKK